MKKILSLLIVLSILFSVNIYALDISYKDENNQDVKLSDFIDTQGHWAHDIILKVAEYELVVGDNGNFMPNQPIKRGDLAIILDRMLGLKTTTYNMFNDLPNDAYYRESLLKCVAAGYIAGVGANEVNPNGYATREQVAVIISRVFNLDTTYSSSTSFKDDNKISSWARSSVSAMNRLGYLNGSDDNCVNPQANITRAEFVTLLNNIANVYIPKSDKSGQGTEFRGTYPSNIVTSRNIELTNSEVGRDIVLTQDCSSLYLINTTVYGRILALSRVNIDMSNSKIQRLELIDGKSSITGSDCIEEVYIGQYASESTLDKIPNRVFLESGVRVSINGTMYENETTRTKTYYAKDLQADIADEQGYIVGGPKISNVTFEQDMDNTITVSGIRVTTGDANIKEIGVIWLEQDDKKDAINPTYKKNDGKKVYRSNKIDEDISFKVGEVEGTCAYRVYVVDKDGLYAYSNSTIFTEYGFTTSLKVYDNDYPQKIDVEVVFRGNNIPNLTSVRVVYDSDEIYSESHLETTLNLYKDPDAETQPDETKYKRYTATITSPSEYVDGETVYIPPTAFGYIITFNNGTVVNRFPVLTNVVPDGVSPMADLDTGTAEYSNKLLNIKNNRITTRYAVPQEVGVVYKVSSSTSITRPTIDSNGWVKKTYSLNIGTTESRTFNVSIPFNNIEAYTYYAVYVKTSNGYWYGDVKKFNNDILGDEGGPRILTTYETVVLNETTAVVGFTISDLSGNFDLNAPFIISAIRGEKEDSTLLNKGISKFKYCVSNDDNRMVYVLLENLVGNTSYDLGFQIRNSEGLKSNILNVNFNTKDVVSLFLGEKGINAYNWIEYPVIFGHDKIFIKSSGHTITDGRIDGSTDSSFVVIDVDDYENTKATLLCEYMPIGYADGFEFKRTVILR